MAKDGKSEITFMRGARSFIRGRFETLARQSPQLRANAEERREILGGIDREPEC